MKYGKRILIAGLSIGALGTGCTAENVASEPSGWSVSVAALAPCANNGDGAFPPGADRVVVKIEGTDAEGKAFEPVIRSFDPGDLTSGGEAVIPGVPPGGEVSVTAVACAGTSVVHEGRTDHVAIEVQKKSFVPLFLTPIDAVSCVGTFNTASGATKPVAGRAFAALAHDDDGVMLMGGFEAFDQKQNPPFLEAHNAIGRYDRARSEFSPKWLGLNEGRGAAIAQRLPNGQIRVIGGTNRLLLNAKMDAGVGRTVLSTRADNAPKTAGDLIDRVNETVVSIPGPPLPALPSMALTPDGVIVAVGGLVSDGTVDTYSKNAEVFHLDNTRTVIPLVTPRFGATVIPLGGGKVLVWGGALSGAAVDSGEIIDVVAETSIALTGATKPVGSQPQWAAGALLSNEIGTATVLIIGGSKLSEDGGKPLFSPRADDRIQRLTITVNTGKVNVTNLTPADGKVTATLRRAGASALVLDDGTIAVFGGMTNFSEDAQVCPGETVCFPSTVARIAISGDGVGLVGEPRDLDAGSLGAALGATGDGAWLITGGLEGVGSAVTDVLPVARLIRFTPSWPELCADPQ